jgi:hypothetical protein
MAVGFGLPCTCPPRAHGGEIPAFRFDKTELGKTPAGWKAAKTGRGDGSVWKVAADETAPSKHGLVLAQTAASPGSVFNLCVATEGQFKDLELSVSFKAMSGDSDQGGGLVWRYRDADNYYVVRMNPLEDNFRVYKVVAGKRIQLGSKEGLKVPIREWHVIKIVHVGRKIECYLDGTKQLEVEDDAFGTEGAVGLWTKADAQTFFDEFRVRALTK